MPHWSTTATRQFEELATPQSEDNDYFISKDDLNNTRSEIVRLANDNAGKGEFTLHVETEKGYTTLAVELDGNTILSVTCMKKAAVRLTGGEGAW